MTKSLDEPLDALIKKLQFLVILCALTFTRYFHYTTIVVSST